MMIKLALMPPGGGRRMAAAGGRTGSHAIGVQSSTSVPSGART